jgi:hypothetical protein
MLGCRENILYNFSYLLKEGFLPVTNEKDASQK